MKIIGCVLAGGKSSRMGQDKSLMIYNGQKLIDHMAKLLLSAEVKKVVISGDNKNTIYPNINDLVCNLGPVGGVISIVLSEEIKDIDFIVFVPVDMPLLNPELINKLLSSIVQNNKQAVCFDNFPLPMVLKIDVSTFFRTV